MNWALAAAVLIPMRGVVGSDGLS